VALPTKSRRANKAVGNRDVSPTQSPELPKANL
jgi:hypothetical protein